MILELPRFGKRCWGEGKKGGRRPNAKNPSTISPEYQRRIIALTRSPKNEVPISGSR